MLGLRNIWGSQASPVKGILGTLHYAVKGDA